MVVCSSLFRCRCACVSVINAHIWWSLWLLCLCVVCGCDCRCYNNIWCGKMDLTQSRMRLFWWNPFFSVKLFDFIFFVWRFIRNNSGNAEKISHGCQKEFVILMNSRMSIGETFITRTSFRYFQYALDGTKMDFVYQMMRLGGT